MPNHVTNTVEIYLWHDEDKEALQKFLNLIQGEEEVIDFATIIPQPGNLFTGNLSNEDRKQCAREGRPNWYDWQTENWGTKWNAYDQSILEQDGYQVTIQFDTAWSPPEPIIERLREMLDELYSPNKGYDMNVSGHWVEEGHQSAGVF